MLSILVLSFSGRSSSELSSGKTWKRQFALEKVWCCTVGFQKTPSGLAKVIPGMLWCHFALDRGGQVRAGLFLFSPFSLGLCKTIGANGEHGHRP